MQAIGQDYYDIPEEWLPSANFAARPDSEISDLRLLEIDRLWTFISSASSSSEGTNNEDDDDNDDDLTPTAPTPDTSLIPQPEMSGTPLMMPDTTVTTLSRRQSLRNRIRSIGDVATIMRKPSLRKTADTALPVASKPAECAPQVPRRAVSARLQKREAPIGRHSRNMSSESDLKARRVLGMDDFGIREEISVSAAPRKDSEDIKGNESFEKDDMCWPRPRPSFSRKPRVREALERKPLTRLRMDFAGSQREKFADSPQSILGTPLELYAISERQPRRFRPTSAIHGRRGSSTPASPERPSPFLQPPPRSGDTSEGFENLEDLYQTRVYVPGSTCLEEYRRKDTVAASDLFVNEIDSEQIVVYFDSMDLMEEATDKCLDRYWLDTTTEPPLYTDFGVMELEPTSPRSQLSEDDISSPLSRFSFSSASSASSDAFVPQETPQKRQLIRLRRLLSPGLPGLQGSEN